MVVTGIRLQKNRQNRFAVFIDGAYALSLSDRALLESKLVRGQEVDAKSVEQLKKLAAEDLLYDRTLQYVSLRLRSTWEVSQYLKRRQASPALISEILNKLSKISLIDDEQFAAAFVRERQRLHPSSRRKILFELKNKHVTDEVIEKVIKDSSEDDDTPALRTIITRKRKESRYRDDMKLMQYLSRQGFNYGDIKDALKDE
jgi:regulatory protein